MKAQARASGNHSTALDAGAGKTAPSVPDKAGGLLKGAAHLSHAQQPQQQSQQQQQRKQQRKQKQKEAKQAARVAKQQRGAANGKLGLNPLGALQKLKAGRKRKGGMVVVPPALGRDASGPDALEALRKRMAVLEKK